MGLSEERKALVQSFMAHRAMRLSDLDRVIQAIHGDALPATQINAAYIANEVSIINTALSQFSFEIRRTADQRAGGDLWVFVNAAADNLTQFATTHTANEIAYFRCLLYVICSLNNTRTREALCVSQQEALLYAHAYPAGYEVSQSSGNGQPTPSLSTPARSSPDVRKRARRDDNESATSSPPRLTATQSGLLQGPGLARPAALQALSRFVQEGWLHKSSSDFYSLTPRSLMELQTYLQEMYGPEQDDADMVDATRPDRSRQAQLIKPCVLCKELVLQGYRCTDLDCSARIHSFCFSKWEDLSTSSGRKCRTCQRQIWDREQMLPVGERVFKRGLVLGDRTSAQTPTSFIGRKRRTALLEEDDDDAPASSQPGSVAGYEDDD
jgi:hypothetical protein